MDIAFLHERTKYPEKLYDLVDRLLGSLWLIYMTPTHTELSEELHDLVDRALCGLFI